MTHIPQSDILSTTNLSRVFNSTTATYKFYWFPIDTKITKNEKGEVAIIKKYELQRFASQHEADCVIRDFGRIVKDNAGIELFKNNFYE